MEIIAIRQGLTKILRTHLKHEKSIELVSTERMLK